jgi:hypothetical protein
MGRTVGPLLSVHFSPLVDVPRSIDRTKGRDVNKGANKSVKLDFI